MGTSRRITFAVPVRTRGDVLENNLLASPCFRTPHYHQVLIQENFSSAARAYNDAIERSLNDLIVFCHQDIFFPESWPSELERALDYLEDENPKWGVLGCGGMTRDGGWRGWVY